MFLYKSIDVFYKTHSNFESNDLQLLVVLDIFEERFAINLHKQLILKLALDQCMLRSQVDSDERLLHLERNLDNFKIVFFLGVNFHILLCVHQTSLKYWFKYYEYCTLVSTCVYKFCRRIPNSFRVASTVYFRTFTVVVVNSRN